MACSTRGPPSISSTSARARVDAAELAAQRVARDLGQRAGHLHAGRAGADHGEGEQGALARRVGLDLGRLEAHQDAAADLEGIGQRLEAGRHARPVVVAEVAVGRAGGDDQVVPGQARAVGQLHLARGGIDRVDFARAGW